LQEIPTEDRRTADSPFRPGKTADVELSLAAVGPETESVNYLNRVSMPLVSSRRRSELRAGVMSATIPSEVPQFRSAGAASARLHIESGDAKPHSNPYAFPERSTATTLPARMREEILDFLFLHFPSMRLFPSGVTFEQFLQVVTAVRPEILHEIQ
jgi:hypothetical protein